MLLPYTGTFTIQLPVPSLACAVVGTNLIMNWHGYPGVTYQLYSSTNLVDWEPWADPVLGTNGPVELPVPVEGDPQKYFRLQATP